MADQTVIIGGQYHRAPATFPVIDPATGNVGAEAPDCSPEMLDEAMSAAQAAFSNWREDEDARCVSLSDAAQRLRDNAPLLGPLLTAEHGKPLASAQSEAEGASLWFDYYADLVVEPIVVQDNDAGYAEVVRRPVGVVAAIAPWNFPLYLACWKLAPALRAGNTVVLKPSPYTPLSTLKMVEILSEALPLGVLNVVSGGDELGRRMTAHPVPRKISFTGSIASGRDVAVAAAADLKRVTLELGGNDAAIVLPDADVSMIADKIFWGAFANNGQACAAIKRVYVASNLHDDLVDALAARAKSVKVGDGREAGTVLGPVSNAPQFERITALVDDARRGGAHIAAGGAPLDRDGYFFPPTILAEVSDGTRIVDEEQFGPALPIVRYQDVDDAVARANASEYGLCGSVWSADADWAAAVADSLECGTAWVNTHMAMGPHQPFGGVKHSGIGAENGIWGLEAFTDIRVRHRAR